MPKVCNCNIFCWLSYWRYSIKSCLMTNPCTEQWEVQATTILLCVQCAYNNSSIHFFKSTDRSCQQDINCHSAPWSAYFLGRNDKSTDHTRTPGDAADVPASKLLSTYRISTISFPLQSCRFRFNCVVIFLKGLFFASASDSSGAGTGVSISGTWTAAL